MAEMPAKSFTVDGVTYETRLLPATVGRGIYLELIKLVGPALSSFQPHPGDTPETAFATMILAIFERFEGSTLDKWCETFGRVTRIPREGGETLLTPDNFAIAFAGKYKSIMQWLIKCLDANGMLDFLPETFKKRPANVAAPST